MTDDTESDGEFYSLSDKDNWQTPPDLVAGLDQAVGGFDLDPCAHPQTDIGSENYCIERGEDGLVEDWHGRVFVNPPFSYKSDWLEKATNEVASGRVETAVVLTPDSTDTKSWWHEYIAPEAEYICFCEGRVSYYDSGERAGSPTFGTAISVFGRAPPSLVEELSDWGHVVRSVE